MSTDLHNSKRSAWIIMHKTISLFEIGWAVIEKSQPEHGPKMTRLCDLLPAGSRLFQRRDFSGLPCCELVSCQLQQFSRKSISAAYVTRWLRYVPLGPISGSRRKMSNDIQNSKWAAWTIIYTTVNLFEIGWVIIDKLQPEHNLKFTHLCDLLPTGSRLWRHFQSKCKDYRALHCGKFRSC